MSITAGSVQTGKKQCIGGKFAVAMFISVLFVVVMLCAAFGGSLYQCLRGLPFCVKFTVSLVLEGILLRNVFAIGRINHSRLRKRMPDLKTFRYNEVRFFVLRCTCYVRAVVTIAAAMISKSLRLSICFGVTAFIDVVLLGCCVYHTVLRGSFRKYPSIVVALSAAIFYVALLVLPYPTDLLLGFLNGTVVYSVVTRLTTYLATGLVVVAMVGVASTFGQRSLERFYTSETGGNSDTWENFKRLRLRLLTHLWTHPQNLVEFARCCYTLLIVFAAAAAVSIFAPLFMATGPEEPSFSFFLGILGAGLLFIGFILYFNVLDENLLKAEYSYVCFKLLHLKKRDVEEKTMRWKDYCQVVSNIYCSSAGITSEGDFLHSLWEPSLKDLSEKTDSCEAYLILCLVQAHQRTAQMYFNHVKSEPEDNERIAADLIRQHFKRIRASGPTEQATFNELICFAFDCLVKNCGKRWERQFQKLGFSLETAKTILSVDILNFYLCKQPENSLTCRTRMLCKGGAGKNCVCSNACEEANDEAEIDRKVFLLSFPVILYNCIAARWGDTILENSCWEDFEAYYVALYEGAQNNITRAETIKSIAEQWFMDIYPHYRQMKSCISRSVERIWKNENGGGKTRVVDAKGGAMNADCGGIILKIASEPAETIDEMGLKTLVFLEFYKNNTPERSE